MIKIKVWGIINMQTSSIFESAIFSLKDDNEPILILINSVGGNIGDTIAIRNLIKSVPNPIITVALGNCISAASMIFSLGNSRYIGKDTNYMIHQPYMPYNTNINYNKAISSKNVLKKDLEVYRNSILSDDVKIPKDISDRVFKKGEDLYLSTKDCLKYNIATNKFTTWKDLYTREKINRDEEIALFDVLVSPNIEDLD